MATIPMWWAVISGVITVLFIIWLLCAVGYIIWEFVNKVTKTYDQCEQNRDSIEGLWDHVACLDKKVKNNGHSKKK